MALKTPKLDKRTGTYSVNVNGKSYTGLTRESATSLLTSKRVTRVLNSTESKEIPELTEREVWATIKRLRKSLRAYNIWHTSEEEYFEICFNRKTLPLKSEDQEPEEVYLYIMVNSETHELYVTDWDEEKVFYSCTHKDTDKLVSWLISEYSNLYKKGILCYA
jgi:hypothetical protein